MEYFFLPGRLKELSEKELNCVCRTILGTQYTLSIKHNYFLLKTDVSADFVEKVFFKLGGFLKYGEILNSDLLSDEMVRNVTDKVVFGISSYSLKYNFEDIKKLAHTFKKEFVQLKKKVRFVLPQENVFLNSPQVLKNNLITNGFELVLLEDHVGRTLGVQDIDSFSLRDYGKPFVDTQMGVLPVKLARMMVNLACVREGQKVWDPFCGSGNILLEAMDLGYDVLGSDIDEKSLEGSEKNVEWFREKFNSKKNAQVFFLDILNPTKSKWNILQNSNIGGIVCEPYMGKPQRKPLEIQVANSLVKQHYSLVSSLFNVLNTISFEKSIRVVVVFPEYRTKKGWCSIEKKLLNFKNVKLLEKDLHWSRENSIIKRLIFVFEYK